MFGAIIEPLSLVRCSQKFQRICSSEKEEEEVLDATPLLSLSLSLLFVAPRSSFGSAALRKRRRRKCWMPSAIIEPLSLVRFPSEVPADLRVPGGAGGGGGVPGSGHQRQLRLQDDDGLRAGAPAPDLQ